MRDKWPECMQIGRDLVRLLQNVSKVPEFETLWRDLTLNPTALSPQFGGLIHLLRTPTRRRCLISRLTPDMERKIYFLIAQVKFGLHRRYQEWFQRQYLSTPESQSIRIDLIRYICAVVHPTNEQLNSNLTPRWAVIGWLLNTCTNVIDCANLKLALFFDWFFYDARKDNIMLIEPAILIMYQSIRTHMNITCMLMDFLCRIVYAYSPALREHLYMGITSAFRDSVEKRVIPSIGVFYDAPKLDKELRNLLLATFPLVFAPPPAPVSPQINTNQIIAEAKPPQIIEVPSSYPSPSPSPTPEDIKEQKNMNIKDEEAVVESGVVVTPVQISVPQQQQQQLVVDLKPQKVFISDEIARINIDVHLAALNNEYLARTLTKMAKSVEADAQCSALDEALNYCLKNSDAIAPVLPELALVLLAALKNNFSNNLISSQQLNDPDHLYTHYIQVNNASNEVVNSSRDEASSMLIDDALNEAINKRALFILFKYISSDCKILLELIKEIHAKQKRVNYFYLFYACVNRDDDSCFGVYKELIKREFGLQHDLSKQQLSKYLMADLKQCEADDVDLFVFLVPFVCRKHFGMCCWNNAEFIGLLVSCVDARQLMALQTLIMYDELKLFKLNLMQSFEACLDASLGFESIEQVFFWKLLTNHAVVLDNPACLFNFFVRIDAGMNHEAMGACVQLLRSVEPTLDVVQCVLSRKEDYCTRALFITWVKRFEGLLRGTLVKVLAKCWQHLKASDFKPVVVKKLNKVGEFVPPENILAHLDQLRLSSECLKLITDEQVQDGLMKIYKSYCDDELKRRFADLFTLIDEFEPGVAQKGRKKGSLAAANEVLKGKQQLKRMKNAKKASNESDNDSEEDSDENSSAGSGSGNNSAGDGNGKQPPRKKLKQLQSDNDSE